MYLASLKDHCDVMSAMVGLESSIKCAADVISASLKSGGKLLICGNGGSAADSQHMAAELTGRFVKDRRPLAAIALTTDTSAITAIANDYDFAEIFARQVRAIGKPGDCLLLISTSGKSENVLRAASVARGSGIHAIALTGRDGGWLSGHSDFVMLVPGKSSARIQEAHIFVIHEMCSMIEASLGVGQ